MAEWQLPKLYMAVRFRSPAELAEFTPNLPIGSGVGLEETAPADPIRPGVDSERIMPAHPVSVGH